MIYHITHKDQWQKADLKGIYTSESLQTQGFIHCAKKEQIIPVANYRFKNQKDLVILCIDEKKCNAEIVYENTKGHKKCPHIYGPINTDAVVRVVEFRPNKNGEFSLPDNLNIN